MNIVNLLGRIAKTPETRTAGTTTITTLIVATDRVKLNNEGKSYKDPETGYTAKETEWHRITCFNGLGKTVAQYATKGMLVSVRGRIHCSKWTDREGVERYGCEIIAEDVQFLSRGKSASGGEPSGQNDIDDDLPF